MDGMPIDPADTPHQVLDAAARIVEPRRVVLSPLVLRGEPDTDKAFRTANGTWVRARVKVRHVERASAPVNGDAATAPSTVTVLVSLALLDEEKAVARDASGAFLIMDAHEVTFSADGMSNPEFDPEAALATVLEQEAARLEARMGVKGTGGQIARLDSLLSGWGGTLAPEPVEAPEMPGPPPPDESGIAPPLTAADVEWLSQELAAAISQRHAELAVIAPDDETEAEAA